MSETITVQSRDTQDITDRVRARYAAAAAGVRSRAQTGCCADACCGDPVTGNLYDVSQTENLPEDAVVASLGCGNPTALIDLREGETVLDLGSGGGIDVLLSARRVGPTGFAFGLDMTDEMLALALANKAKAGARNVAFLKGRIEDIPLPANSVDVVISNCVINLSADKGQVLREAFRVLKPGGRFAVSDVVAEGPVPAALRANMEAWVGCLAGALEVDTYRELLAERRLCGDRHGDHPPLYRCRGWPRPERRCPPAGRKPTGSSPARSSEPPSRPRPPLHFPCRRRQRRTARVAVRAAVPESIWVRREACRDSLPTLLK